MFSVHYCRDYFGIVLYQVSSNKLNKLDMKTTKSIRKRLEYLRQEIREERISYGEIFELQSLAEYIVPGDVELLEWAGVPEFAEE